MGGELERLESEEQTDRLIEASTALGELVLTGGVPVATLVGYFARRATAGRLRRQAALLDELAVAVGKIAGRLDTEFVKSEEFEGLTEQIIESGQRHREIDKREFYAAMFANSMLPSRPDEAERDRMIATIERLRPSHLWLLAVLLAEYQWPEGHGMTSGFEQEFKSQVDVNIVAVRRDWQDLEAEHILGGYPSGAMSQEGARNFRDRVTDYGRAFHQFVTLPYEDTHPPS